jgi:transposase
MSKYSNELKEKIIRAHLQEGRSQVSLEREYNLDRGTVSRWVKLDWLY